MKRKFWNWVRNEEERTYQYPRCKGRSAAYHSFLTGTEREPIHFRELHMGNPQKV